MAEKVWTQEQEIDAAAKVFTAVSELLNGESHLSSRDAIIAAHNTNAKRLQCENTQLEKEFAEYRNKYPAKE